MSRKRTSSDFFLSVIKVVYVLTVMWKLGLLCQVSFMVAASSTVPRPGFDLRNFTKDNQTLFWKNLIDGDHHDHGQKKASTELNVKNLQGPSHHLDYGDGIEEIVTVIEEQQPLGGDGSSGFFNSSPTNAAVNRLFKFEAFGSRFILRTKPDSQFLAEDVIVTYGRQNDSWAHMVAPSTRRCFHVGQEPGSKVVLNVCNGLFGHIATQDAIYFIRPAASLKNPNSSAVEHVIQRFGIVKAEIQHCDASEFSPKSSLSSSLGPLSWSNSLFTNNQHRSKRSVSRDLYVEVMVTADSTMKDYYGEGLSDYIMTLMSIVTHIFRDPSLGNSITLTVVKIVVEEHEDRDFVTTHAPTTLRKFCKWQAKKKYAEGWKYDVAILLTRVDICRSHEKCDTLGLADLGTVCNDLRSCAITEDNGLSAAFTVAHELGHVFNLPHDDDTRCLNFSARGITRNIMARFMTLHTDPWTWSSCSTHYLTEFLETDAVECLLDKPRSDRLVTRLLQGGLPGESYDVDLQCEMLYGAGTKMCPFMAPCRSLWCMIGDGEGCRSHHIPWADGTRCGEDKCCYRGECRYKNSIDLRAVDGQWGEWSPFGECSRTCGGGIQRSIRLCDSPKPRNGGKYCIGERIKFRSCQTQGCPPNSVDFRALQCADFNRIHFEALGLEPNIQWLPKYSGIQSADQCKLYCRISGTGDFYMLRDKVVDGTKCGLYTYDVCVNGRCKPAGCDNKLYSKMTVDSCGECGGKNQNCRKVTGHFNTSKSGYNRVVLIPTGSANVFIEQHGFRHTKEDDNYLALRSDKGEYILNGDLTVTTSRRIIEYGGTLLEYTGTNVVVERINSSRPLTRDLVVEVLSLGKLRPPDIRYQYNEIARKPINSQKYSWGLERTWSSCSRICQGQQSRRTICMNKVTDRRVNEDRCRRTPKPRNFVRSCNDHCTLSWVVVSRGECQTTSLTGCGVGVVDQKVICQQRFTAEDGGITYEVEASNCKDLLEKKPQDRAYCYKECQEGVWEYTSWTQCSKTCNGGTQTRQATCHSANGQVQLADEHCRKENMEPVMRSCAQVACPDWRVSDWTTCSQRCDGVRMRPIWCQLENVTVPPGFCSGKPMPVIEEACSDPSCYSWHYGEWSKCSVTCGVGMIRRMVRCRMVDGNLTNDDLCQPDLKPPATMPCDSAVQCSTSLPPLSTTPQTSQNDYNGGTLRTSFKWQKGPWSQCSASCGNGHRFRSVTCVEENEVNEGGVDESRCMTADQEKPTIVESCLLKPCGSWRVGDWNQCSKSCGGGAKRRVVVCQDENHTQVETEFCDSSHRPESSLPCNEESCSPHWTVGDWTECSENCGWGNQRRHVECIGEAGEVRSESDCPASERPVNELKCKVKECQHSTEDPFTVSGNSDKSTSNGYSWRTGPWSSCSVTCGSGIQQRQVICLGQWDEIVHVEQCLGPAPSNIQTCTQPGCPQWTFSDSWSQCSKSCGGGEQWRMAVCYREGHRVDTKLCLMEQDHSRTRDQESTSTPPVEKRACGLEECPVTARWQKMPWTECSSRCIKSRQVICVDGHGKSLDDSACSKLNKPKTMRRCPKCKMEFLWVNGTWSECSTTCGRGYRTRNVECHRVNRYGWIYPEVHSQESDCSSTRRPSRVQTCNLGDCDAKYRWVTTLWQKCSVECGQGYHKRQVYCSDRQGHKVAKRNCYAYPKPPRSQRCHQRPCVPITCAEIQKKTRAPKDGHYNIWIRGKMIRIYCAEMHTLTPKEYLTLGNSDNDHEGRDEWENYSEFYEKRLIRADSCPSNGQRLETCHCIETGPMSGLTIFQKIRLNITSLTVISDDFRFTRQVHGQPIEYGKAGDCYSLSNCPQGRFSINLSGTGLVVDKSTKWVNDGHHPQKQITGSSGGQRIRGQCGGYCGVCMPDPRSGLMLDVDQPP